MKNSVYDNGGFIGRVADYTATDYYQTITGNSLNHRYLKWSITAYKGNTSETIIQVSELYLKYTGSAVSWGSATITNPNGNNPSNEGPANLIDGNISSKVLDFDIDVNGSSVFIIDAGSGNTLQADSYYYVTGGDAEQRDPISWTIEGSNDGTNYTVLHTVTNATITTSRRTSTQEFSMATITNKNKKNTGVWSMDADYLNADTSLDIDAVYGTTYRAELTAPFPSSNFSSGSGGSGQIDVTWIFDMTFSTTDTGCILDQGGGVDGTYVGMVSGGNLRLSTSGAVSGVSNETSTTTTDMSAYAGVAGQLIVTIDYQNHIQCWWNDSTNGINQVVSVDYNGDGDWAGSNTARVGQGSGTGTNVHGSQDTGAFTGTITRYREITAYVDTSTF